MSVIAFFSGSGNFLYFIPIKAIEKIKGSSFLQGKSNSRRAWVVSFDWFVLPNNFPKVLDGNYDDVKSDEPHETKTLEEDGWQ